MNEEERRSQVSALFDGELDDGQCDLVVRRILKDPQALRSWSRYAVIGASLRGEPVTVPSRQRADVASRVSALLETEPVVESAPVALPRARSDWSGSAQKALWGSALAATVAALSILVVRMQGGADGAPVQMAQTPVAVEAPAVVEPPAVQVASAGPAAITQPRQVGDIGAAPSYTTPVGNGSTSGLSAPLVNYVVAHSEYLTPVMRFNPLSASMMGSFEPGDEQLVEATEAEIGAARR